MRTQDLVLISTKFNWSKVFGQTHFSDQSLKHAEAVLKAIKKPLEKVKTSNDKYVIFEAPSKSLRVF